ncbi:MAG: hypothetical protein R6X10_11300 [Desulfobacterales bacterium]
MKINKKNEKEICPFMDGDCIKGDCFIYEAKLDRCSISLMAYNAYRLSESIKKLCEK